MKKKMLLVISAVVSAAALFYVPAKADGIIIPEPPICEPCPIPSPMSQLEIRYHHVTVTIEDQIATNFLYILLYHHMSILYLQMNSLSERKYLISHFLNLPR